MPATIHAPWDGGEISANPFFLAACGPQRTIKARCGKRVKYSDAPAGEALTCPGCVAEIEREAAAMEVIKKYAADLESRGLDYANAEANRK